MKTDGTIPGYREGEAVMISVVIPFYNTGGYMKRCINSVLASSYRDFELILVDDGSVDRSSLTGRQYCKKDCRVKYFRQGHKGVSAARNRGLAESRGTWIVFVDSDDFISPDFLETIAGKEYQAQELLLFDAVKLKKGRRIPGGRKTAAAEAAYNEKDRLYLVESLLHMGQLRKNGSVSLASPCAKAYKKSVIDKYRLRFAKNLAICEDRLFNLEYLLRAGSCTYIPKQVYFVEAREDSAMRGFTWGYLQNDIQYQKRLQALLKEYGIFPEVKDAYYNSVLSNMADILVRGVFHPSSTRTYGENCRQCGKMQGVEIYRRAIKYNKGMGRLPRRLLLFFYQRKCYFVVMLICRISYSILEVTGRI